MIIPVSISFAPTVPEPWSAAVIQTEFPMKSASAAALKRFVTRLLFSASREARPVFYANTNFMHQDSLWKEFSKNGPAWKPTPGVGVFPDDPPRLMTPEDFYGHEFGKKIRSMLDPVLAIAPADNNEASALFTMISGYGNTTVIFSTLAAPALGKQMTAGVLPLVADDTFRSFDLYVPLLNGRNLGCLANAASLASALDNVPLYFRECPEENTILIAAREPLPPAFEAAGLTFDRASKTWGLQK